MDLRRWPAGRKAAFGLGCAVAVGAVLSPLARDARTSLPADVVQFVLLLYVAGPLLGAGRPQPHRGNGAARRSTWVLALAAPLVAFLLTLVWFFTPWLALTTDNLPARLAGYLLLLAAGSLFAVPASRLLSAASDSAYPALLLASLIELLIDMVPGMLLTFDSHVHTGGLVSRHFGGELLWALADVADVPFLAALVAQWLRADARSAASIDAALDAAAARAGAGAVAGDPGSGGDQQPWWEADGSVFGTRSAQYRRQPGGR